MTDASVELNEDGEWEDVEAGEDEIYDSAELYGDDDYDSDAAEPANGTQFKGFGDYIDKSTDIDAWMAELDQN